MGSETESLFDDVCSRGSHSSEGHRCAAGITFVGGHLRHLARGVVPSISGHGLFKGCHALCHLLHRSPCIVIYALGGIYHLLQRIGSIALPVAIERGGLVKQ